MEKTDVRMYEVGVLPGRNHILHIVRKGSRHSEFVQHWSYTGMRSTSSK